MSFLQKSIQDYEYNPVLTEYEPPVLNQRQNPVLNGQQPNTAYTFPVDSQVI